MNKVEMTRGEKWGGGGVNAAEKEDSRERGANERERYQNRKENSRKSDYDGETANYAERRKRMRKGEERMVEA